MHTLWDQIDPACEAHPDPWFEKLATEFGQELPIQVLGKFVLSDRTLSDLQRPENYRGYFANWCRNEYAKPSQQNHRTAAPRHELTDSGARSHLHACDPTTADHAHTRQADPSPAQALGDPNPPGPDPEDPGPQEPPEERYRSDASLDRTNHAEAAQTGHQPDPDEEEITTEEELIASYQADHERRAAEYEVDLEEFCRPPDQDNHDFDGDLVADYLADRDRQVTDFDQDLKAMYVADREREAPEHEGDLKAMYVADRERLDEEVDLIADYVAEQQRVFQAGWDIRDRTRAADQGQAPDDDQDRETLHPARPGHEEVTWEEVDSGGYPPGPYLAERKRREREQSQDVESPHGSAHSEDDPPEHPAPAGRPSVEPENPHAGQEPHIAEAPNAARAADPRQPLPAGPAGAPAPHATNGDAPDHDNPASPDREQGQEAGDPVAHPVGPDAPVSPRPGNMHAHDRDATPDPEPPQPALTPDPADPPHTSAASGRASEPQTPLADTAPWRPRRHGPTPGYRERVRRLKAAAGPQHIAALLPGAVPAAPTRDAEKGDRA